MYELAVVGLGLIGSGALRHAAKASGNATSIVGIGPAEPEVWSSHDGPFASHYDSGRVTRRLDARSEWGMLAARAIAQYPEIERQAGLSFHRPSGLIFVRRDPDGIANLIEVADRLQIDIEVSQSEAPLEVLPQLSFPDGYTRVAEPAPAGAIDPRRMITAQHRAAVALGASVVREAVVSIQVVGSHYDLMTTTGVTLQAERVILAAGAYTNGLLTDLADPLATAVRPEAVAMGRIDGSQVDQLAAMPSIIYLLDHPQLDDVYIVPPAQYPDGHWYIKIGGSHRLAATFDNRDAMNDWMRPGAADQHLDALRGVLTDVLPDVTFTAWRTRPCLIADTASGLPYIDTVADRLVVAAGGNGHAAKSADAIGALAADQALSGRWNDTELSANDFAARFGTYAPPEGSRHGN